MLVTCVRIFCTTLFTNNNIKIVIKSHTFLFHPREWEKERELEKERERERKRERNKERERNSEKERDKNKVEIDTYLFVKWNKQIKLGRFRQYMVYTKLSCEKHFLVQSITLYKALHSILFHKLFRVSNNSVSYNNKFNGKRYLYCVLYTLVTEYIVDAPNNIIFSSSQYCTYCNWQLIFQKIVFSQKKLF